MGKSLLMIFITSAIVLVATNLYGTNQHDVKKSGDILQQTVLASDTQKYEDSTSAIIDNNEYDEIQFSGDYEILGDGFELEVEDIEPTTTPINNPTSTPTVTK